jgi:ribonuclease R
VRAGTRLDGEAQLRGNSVYFPDRVVPMLPERISNDLCSLKEGEERPCIAVRMVFDKEGNKTSHTFMRGMMRSAAKLSYEEAQAAADGRPSPKCRPLLDRALRPLWAAYAALATARDRREPLDLDLPERKILIGRDGRVERVVTPERLTAHRLIEEFMIQANVAAAETLEGRRAPIIYRVHDAPSKEKLAALREFLESLDLSLARASSLRPADFNRILRRARALPVSELVSEVVLRSQSQAVYSADNLGHFGLNLRRYAHFTSPIRRYADLIVHRCLIRALGLGAGGISDDQAGLLKDMAQAISDAERRAMAAERDTADRLIAGYLADRVGAEFTGRISGVIRSSLFVRLNDTGADGLVPAATLGNEYYRHDEGAHALIGDRTGQAYRLGDEVSVRLVEAIPSAGALRFEMLSPGRPMFGNHARPRRAHGPLRRRKR